MNANPVTKLLLGMGIEPGAGPVPQGERAKAGAGMTIVPRSERITGQTITYDQLVDMLLMSPPGETQGALARRVGYSQAWLSRIIASDAFQAKLAARIEKDLEPERREMFRLRFASIEEEARGILHTSLQKLAARLDDPAGVPDQLVVKSAEMTSRLLGYGARQEPPQPKVEMHVHLENLANNLRNLNRAPIAGEVVEPAPPALDGPAGANSQGK